MMYELYSAMVHSGGAYGGHYYAYIKNFEDGKWYEFNDSLVSEIDEVELESAYGGPESSASAYMLLYRRVEPENNIVTVPDHLVPPELLVPREFFFFAGNRFCFLYEVELVFFCSKFWRRRSRPRRRRCRWSRPNALSENLTSIGAWVHFLLHTLSCPSLGFRKAGLVACPPLCAPSPLCSIVAFVHRSLFPNSVGFFSTQRASSQRRLRVANERAGDYDCAGIPAARAGDVRPRERDRR